MVRLKVQRFRGARQVLQVPLQVNSAASYPNMRKAVGTLRHGTHARALFALQGLGCKFCNLLRIRPKVPKVLASNTSASTLAFAAGTFPSTLFRTF